MNRALSASRSPYEIDREREKRKEEIEVINNREEEERKEEGGGWRYYTKHIFSTSSLKIS